MNGVGIVSQHASVPSMGKTRWMLKEYLAERDITTYRLAQELERSKAPNLYKLVSKDPEMIGLSTLTSILDGLRNITGETVNVQDLLEYQPD